MVPTVLEGTVPGLSLPRKVLRLLLFGSGKMIQFGTGLENLFLIYRVPYLYNTVWAGLQCINVAVLFDIFIEKYCDIFSFLIPGSWIRNGKKIRIRDEHLRSFFRERRKSFFG